MDQRDNASNQNNESLGIKLIILGSIMNRISDVISSMASTFDRSEITDVKNQRIFEEQEEELQILLNEMNYCTKDLLAQMSGYLNEL